MQLLNILDDDDGDDDDGDDIVYWSSMVGLGLEGWSE